MSAAASGELTSQVIPLDEDDGSAVVVTVARYQTPSGADINKRGISPDVALVADALPVGQVCKGLAAPDAPHLFRS